MTHDFFAALGITYPLALPHQIIFFAVSGAVAIAGFMAKKAQARLAIMALVAILLTQIAIIEFAPRSSAAEYEYAPVRRSSQSPASIINLTKETTR